VCLFHSELQILDEQIRLVNERRAEGEVQRQQDINQARALWARLDEEAAAEEAAEREKMRRLAAELAEFNRLKQTEMSEKDRKERELDLKILQEALAREAQDEAAEAAARAERINAARAYRLQLAQMMHAEAEDEAERDAQIQAVADAQQARRDAELAARETARTRLMQEVDAIRQQQILEKQMRMQADQEAIFQQDTNQLAAEEKWQREEAERQRQSRKKALSQRLELQTQMVAKAHIQAAEEMEKLKQLEHAKQNEEMYMTQVQQTLDETVPPAWHGRKKVDWYY